MKVINQRRSSRAKLYYGLFSAVIAFSVGWAVSIILIEEPTPFDVPTWKSSLWLYMGAHGIPLSDVHLGGLGLDVRQPLDLLENTQNIRYVPPVMSAIAGLYTTLKLSGRGLKESVSTALTAGSAYLILGLFAMVATDMRPSVTTIILIGGAIGAAAWLGSSLLGSLSGGIPFFGITSIGTILAVGFLALIGGAALISTLWKMIAIAYGGPILAGILVGTERSLRYRGKRTDSDWPRLVPIKNFLENYWLEVVILLATGSALYLALSGNI